MKSLVFPKCAQMFKMQHSSQQAKDGSKPNTIMLQWNIIKYKQEYQHKKKWMNLEDIKLSERKQTQEQFAKIPLTGTVKKKQILQDK